MDLLAMVASHHPRAISQDVEDETLVLKLDDGRMGVLNQVGRRVWALMDGTRSLGQIARDCAAYYDVEPEEVEADVIAYAQRLLEREMIVLEDGAS
jgi:hypothetical protein